MSLFTPLQGVLGGSLIGGSTAVLLLLNGDIMGASGILSNTLINPLKSLRDPKNQWRWVYLASFALVVNLYTNYFAPPGFFSDERSIDSDVPIPSIIAHVLGGFLVGFGTRMGNGCTTGHGICGISRLSKRSIIATITFTCMGIATRAIISPVRDWAHLFEFLRSNKLPSHVPEASAVVMASMVLMTFLGPTLAAASSQGIDANEWKINARKTLGAALSGIMFAAGLAISGMTKNSKVHDFLCFSGFDRQTFDPTLIAVLSSGIITSIIAYQFVSGWSMLPKEKALSCPLALGENGKFSVPTNTVIDAQLIGGAVVFGLGWGLTGICPGPAIFAASAGVLDAIYAWIPAFLVGSFVSQKVKDSLDKSKFKPH